MQITYVDPSLELAEAQQALAFLAQNHSNTGMDFIISTLEKKISVSFLGEDAKKTAELVGARLSLDRQKFFFITGGILPNREHDKSYICQGQPDVDYMHKELNELLEQSRIGLPRKQMHILLEGMIGTAAGFKESAEARANNAHYAVSCMLVQRAYQMPYSREIFPEVSFPAGLTVDHAQSRNYDAFLRIEAVNEQNRNNALVRACKVPQKLASTHYAEVLHGKIDIRAFTPIGMLVKETTPIPEEVLPKWQSTS